jgi:hypothetical protein
MIDGREETTEGPRMHNGMRNRGLNEQLRLGRKRVFNRTVRRTLGLEVAKRAFEFSIGVQKMSVKAMWRSQPPPKRKKRILAA